MNKSFIERIFPHTPGSVLPQYSSSSSSYHDSPSSPARSTTSSAGGKRITLRDRSNSPATSSPRSVRSTPTTIRQPTAPPLSASIIHHDDPFLPVERAAKALEKTLQDLINAQSDALESALPQDHQQDDLSSSMGSATPTPSALGISRSTVNSIETASTMPKVIPIRQPPPPKRISLRHARKGLARTMDDFARLKREEVRIAASESSSREAALRQAATFQTKLTDLQTQLETAQHDGSDTGPAALRKEAEVVEREIRDLEHRLFSLRARHAQLGHKAEALENAIDSKLSSFKHSIAGIERETRQFLSRPPVRGSLVSRSHANNNNGNAKSPTRGGGGGMYALPPSRRTLPMATEQWTTEQTLLAQRRDSAEREAQALIDGAELWRNATSRISAFEKSLRARILKTAAALPSPLSEDDGVLAGEIDNLIESLENDYARAEANGWRLLMVAVGAELAALGRARELLVGGESPDPTAGVNGNGNGNGNGNANGHDGREGVDLIEHEQEEGGEDGEGEGNDPPADLLDTTGAMASRRRMSNASNESLQATLEQFSDRAGGKGKLPVRRTTAQADGHNSEDEDDDDDGPSADFLVSHS